MVLATKVGKQRPFWRGLLLTIVTFGLYSLYWNYKAHDEVYEQFELKREGRDEGVVWYILGLVIFPIAFVYYWMFVSNVQYVRQRLDLKGGISPGAFLGLMIAGFFAYFAGIIAYMIRAAALDPADMTEDEFALAALEATGPMFLGLFVFLILMVVAYYRLQRTINEVWDAYESRMAQMQAPPPPEAQQAPAAAPQFRYHADLRPPAEPPAPPRGPDEPR